MQLIILSGIPYIFPMFTSKIVGPICFAPKEKGLTVGLQVHCSIASNQWMCDGNWFCRMLYVKGKRRSSVHTNYLKSVETIQTNLEVYIGSLEFQSLSPPESRCPSF